MFILPYVSVRIAIKDLMLNEKIMILAWEQEEIRVDFVQLNVKEFSIKKNYVLLIIVRQNQ